MLLISGDLTKILSNQEALDILTSLRLSDLRLHSVLGLALCYISGKYGSLDMAVGKDRVDT